MPSKQQLFSELFKNITQSNLITAADINLGNVNNTSDVNKPISTLQQSALNTKQNLLVSGTNIKSVAGRSVLGSGNFSLAKGDIGLENVDNTSDVNKPISTPVQNALANIVQFPEAPVDGSFYVRRSMAWSSVDINTLSLSDAQADGVVYARQNSAWVPVELVSVQSNGSFVTKAILFNFTGGLLIPRILWTFTENK